MALTHFFPSLVTVICLLVPRKIGQVQPLKRALFHPSYSHTLCPHKRMCSALFSEKAPIELCVHVGVGGMWLRHIRQVGGIRASL